MAKILIAECLQEVATFNPVPSRYEDFAIRVGEDLIGEYRGGQLEIGGIINFAPLQPSHRAGLDPHGLGHFINDG